MKDKVVISVEQQELLCGDVAVLVRTTVTTAHGGGPSDEVLDTEHVRHYQVYRGMSPTSSNKLEVKNIKALDTWAKNQRSLAPVFRKSLAPKINIHIAVNQPSFTTFVVKL